MFGSCAKAHGVARPAAAAFKNVLRVETNMVIAVTVYSRHAWKTPPRQGLTLLQFCGRRLRGVFIVVAGGIVLAGRGRLSDRLDLALSPRCGSLVDGETL